MRSIMRQSVMLAGACLLFAGATAHAAPLDALQVKIPFAFIVNGQTFPAGQYMVERDDSATSVLLIRGEKHNHAATFVATLPAGGHDPLGTAPALAFTRDGNQYRLRSVWESSTEGMKVMNR